MVICEKCKTEAIKLIQYDEGGLFYVHKEKGKLGCPEGHYIETKQEKDRLRSYGFWLIK